jgi:hypothetical protein
MTGKELCYINEAHHNGQLSGDGPFTKKCHDWFERELGCRKALLTHSCTAALEMAAILSDIKFGDEIIMPSYTFVSTANAFVLRGGVPVFVDIREDTLNLDETKIEAAITDKTVAIVAVHYAGVACEMDVIMQIAMRHHLLVIEDAATQNRPEIAALLASILSLLFYLTWRSNPKEHLRNNNNFLVKTGMICIISLMLTLGACAGFFVLNTIIKNPYRNIYNFDLDHFSSKYDLTQSTVTGVRDIQWYFKFSPQVFCTKANNLPEYSILNNEVAGNGNPGYFLLEKGRGFSIYKNNKTLRLKNNTEKND